MKTRNILTFLSLIFLATFVSLFFHLRLNYESPPLRKDEIQSGRHSNCLVYERNNYKREPLSLYQEDCFDRLGSNHNKTTKNDHQINFEYKETIQIPKFQILISQENNFVHVVLRKVKENYGSQCIMGGDIFYSTMGSKLHGEWTSGKVIDYDNGTYSLYYYAGWQGEALIDIILIHPRDIILYQKNTLRSVEGNAELLGIFQKGKIERKVVCFMLRDSLWANKCEYRNENSLGETLMVCDKVESVNCEDLKFLVQGGIRDYPYRHIHVFENETFKGTGRSIPILTNHNITLKEDFRSTVNGCLPKCNSQLPEPLSEGYWKQSRWTSMTCNSTQWENQTDIFNCLKGKSLYFIGDSTLRQWYENLVYRLGYNETKAEKNNRLFRKHTFPSMGVNMTFHFHFWYHTFRKYQVKDTLYMADFIDSLSSTRCNHILIITASFHFTRWTRISFEEMMLKTKHSMTRLLSRCPNSVIIVKGSHPREDIINNWILHSINRHLREIFSNSDAIFIDIWDMNLSFPSRKIVHMPETVISQELFLFLSHACSRLNMY